MRVFWVGGAVLFTHLASAGALGAQEPKSRAVEHTVAALPRSLYFVVPPKQPPAAGRKGGLVVVLPGGDGSRDFLPFVENGILAQAPPDCTGVLVTAVKWRADQKVVWPTQRTKVPDMQYTTEDYVRAVTAEVEKATAVDPARRLLVAWSSSGPAVYPLLVEKDGPFARGYVAMSVWPGKALGDLAGAKGRRFFLDQSPEDQVTKFSHVREAFAALDKAGAVVRLSTYAGGHGWLDAPLPRLREGLRWLDSDEPAPAPAWPAAKEKTQPGPKAGPARPGDNLLKNGGFEDGLDGWQKVDNSGRITFAVGKEGAAAGKQALHVQKTGGMPLDVFAQEVELSGAGTVAASVMLKSKGCRNAWIKVWLYGSDGEPLHKEVDLVRVPADGDWHRVQKSWDGKGAVRAVVQVVMVLGGELWLDDFVLTAAK